MQAQSRTVGAIFFSCSKNISFQPFLTDTPNFPRNVHSQNTPHKAVCNLQSAFALATLQNCSLEAPAVDPCCSSLLAFHFFWRKGPVSVNATMNHMEVLVVGAQQGQVGESDALKQISAGGWTRGKSCSDGGKTVPVTQNWGRSTILLFTWLHRAPKSRLIMAYFR